MSSFDMMMYIQHYYEKNCLPRLTLLNRIGQLVDLFRSTGS